MKPRQHPTTSIFQFPLPTQICNSKPPHVILSKAKNLKSFPPTTITQPKTLHQKSPPHRLQTVIPAKAGIHILARNQPTPPQPVIPAKAGIQKPPPEPTYPHQTNPQGAADIPVCEPPTLIPAPQPVIPVTPVIPITPVIPAKAGIHILALNHPCPVHRKLKNSVRLCALRVSV